MYKSNFFENFWYWAKGIILERRLRTVGGDAANSVRRQGFAYPAILLLRGLGLFVTVLSCLGEYESSYLDYSQTPSAFVYFSGLLFLIFDWKVLFLVPLWTVLFLLSVTWSCRGCLTYRLVCSKSLQMFRIYLRGCFCFLYNIFTAVFRCCRTLLYYLRMLFWSWNSLFGIPLTKRCYLGNALSGYLVFIYWLNLECFKYPGLPSYWEEVWF